VLLQRDWRDSMAMSTLSAGESANSLFIDAEGTLLVCGCEGERGILGLPRDHADTEEGVEDTFHIVLVPTPVPCMAGIRIRQVMAGFHCSLALTEAGRVYMWGQGPCGRLASDLEDRLVPTLIQELSHHRVRQVAVGHDLCAAVTEEGLLFTWATAAIDAEFYAPVTDRTRQRLGLGLKNTSIANLWPPQCVSALQEERVSSVAVRIDFTEAGQRCSGSAVWSGLGLG
jgi:hypothetical protein